MLFAAHEYYLPNKTIFVKDDEKIYDPRLLLFQQKSIVEDDTTAYICQNYACELPIKDIKPLKIRLQNC